MLDHISINHFVIGLSDLSDLFFHLILKNIIKGCHTLNITHPYSISFSVFHGSDQEHLKGTQLHNTCISIFSCEIGIVYGITSQSTSYSSGISSVFSCSLFERNKVTLALAHFLSFDINITIAIIGLGPVFFFIPYSCVVEESHSQVVFNQIFCGTSQIHRVPVEE